MKSWAWSTTLPIAVCGSRFFQCAYVPFQAVDASGAPQPIAYGAIIVRTSSSNPLALASILRRKSPRAVRIPGEQHGHAGGVESATNHPRAVAGDAGAVLRGCRVVARGNRPVWRLDYGVLQRRREIGIRMAIGAQAGDIARRVTLEAFAMVLVGAIAGLAAGMRRCATWSRCSTR